MEETTKTAYDQWKELVQQLLYTYSTASEARHNEIDSKKWLPLNNICVKCVKMLSIVEEI